MNRNLIRKLKAAAGKAANFTTVFIIVLLLLTGHTFSQLPVEQTKRIDSLFSNWNHGTTPGMELLILHKGKIIFDRSYGSSNLEKNLPNNSDRKMWVGSMSKQFTALAVALLIDEGRLHMDDDIRKYLPELPGTGDPIRIKHLIYHTSGLRDGFTLTAMSFKGEDQYTNANVIKYLSMQRGRNFRPGERFEYNNSGYVLLATIVERVSGISFPEFTSKYIFQPLGMDHSRFYGEFPVNDTSIAMGYARSEDGNNKNYQPANFKGNSYGSTGLVTTANDLAKWDRIFYEPIFGKKVQQLQQQTGVLNNGEHIPYAFGLEIEEFRGKKAITHSGVDAGFKAEILRFPGEQFTVICLANTEDAWGNTDRLFKISERFLYFEKKKITNPVNTYRIIDSIYINTQTLAAMRFVNKGKEITIATNAGGYPQPLIPLKNGRYKVRNSETDEYLFGGHTLTYRTRADQANFTAIKTVSPAAEQLKMMAGAYYCRELDATYNFFEKDGTLYLKFFDTYDIPLQPYAGNLYAGEFLGTNIIHVITDESRNPIGLEFNREGIHQLLFEKK